ncbi:MAG: Hpt domain-containing protein, partial [Clostridia bacterium]|nr:Hpt domain-containing protein [Clostridia bacterium]
VHSVKGSSASVGANGVSELFRELEMAGKRKDMDYIQQHISFALTTFEQLLDEVKCYLYERGALMDGMSEEMDLSSQDEMKFNKQELITIKQALDQINLKVCEEKINELKKNNYGAENNKKISQLSNSFEMFDYHKVRDLLNQWIDEF